MECKHPGYLVKDGQLVCSVCGAASPRAKLVSGVLVPINQVITCPHCGGRLDSDGKAVIEDKMMEKTEDKRIKRR